MLVRTSSTFLGWAQIKDVNKCTLFLQQKNYYYYDTADNDALKIIYFND